MQMDHPDEQLILDDDEEKNDDVIDEEGVDCELVWQPSIDIRTVERLEPQWDNEK